MLGLPPKKDNKYLAEVAKLLCPIPVEKQPELYPGEFEPCGNSSVPHHKTGAGMGLKADDRETFGICHIHHTSGGYGVAIHAGVEEWERRHGTQDYWIKKTLKLLT